ncbi:hypothetical protein CR513_05702, partial [Mucuna pruriens]
MPMIDGTNSSSKPPNIDGLEDLTSFVLLASTRNPGNFQETITNMEKDRWIDAMVKEIKSLYKNQTWELLELLKGKIAIRKLIVSEKEGEKLKDHLVAKGYSQLKKIDYDEIFFPVKRHFHQGSIGYRICEYDYCVYVKSLDDGSFIFWLLYVDDMLIVINHLHYVNEVKILLRKEFDTSKPSK